MSFFKPQVSFHLNFVSPSSVITYNLSESILTETLYSLDKKAHQSTIFQTFQWSNEISPNFSCHFWNCKLRVYSNLFFQTPLYVLVQTFIYTLHKKSPSKWNFPTCHVILKTTKQFFFLNLCITLQSHDITLPYLFSWNFIWFGQKGAYQNAKFQTFDCSREMSPNFYFDRLLLLKVYKILTKNVQRSYISWHWRAMLNLKKNWFAVSQITIILGILIRALESLTIFTFE